MVAPLAAVALTAATEDPAVLQYMTAERRSMPEEVVRLWYRMGSHRGARIAVEDLMVRAAAALRLLFFAAVILKQGLEEELPSSLLALLRRCA